MGKKIKNIKTLSIIYAMENPSDPDNTEWYEKETFLSSFKEFDCAGNLLKSVSYNKNGQINEMVEYRYDELNNCIEEIFFLDEDEIAEHHFFKYDEKNKKTEERIIYQENGESFVQYIYDESGNLSIRKVTDTDGLTEEIEIFQYRDGKIVSEQLFDEENNMVFQKKYNYDNHGNLISYEYLSSENFENYRMEYFYDEKGFKEKILKYDNSGLLIEKVQISNDNKGNPVEIIEESSQGIKKTCYQYDEKGNSTLQEEFLDDEILILRIEREFNDDQNISESTVFTYQPGDEIYQLNTIKYEYQFYDD